MSDERSQPEGPVPPISHEEQIGRLCGEFEQCWRGGTRPRIEHIVDKVGLELRTVLLPQLVASEVELRRDAGEEVDVEEYRKRFPDETEGIEAGWAIAGNWTVRDGKIEGVANTPRDANRDAVEELETTGDGNSGVPWNIGRYLVQRILGEGGFGRVYLAHDPQLQRQVALKVPRHRWVSSSQRIESLLHEARSAARLKHPALVAVYDVQRDGESVYIVQEYVDGQDLWQWAKSAKPTLEQITRMMIEVAEAIGFAHQHDLIHRDLKPGNLLIDAQGHAHVADFGLALDENAQRLYKGEISGTPAYMSPEQVRGETHRLDGRTDLWSLGVILYELLTRRRPFRRDDQEELFDEIKQRPPKPPRQINPEIPSELERICLKCLAKRPTARYASAAELVDDLQVLLQRPTASLPTPTDLARATPAQPRIVPKGLRSFDEHDADFYLDLLPGPRDREGLPESIRCWKIRVEQIDPYKTFAVGLIYGPSGCGKSSLVKAGLVPRLAAHVDVIYVESASDDTEVRLLNSLRRRFPDIPERVALPDLLAGLRGGRWARADKKILIVLDQFEQWLHARRSGHEPQLVQALRHCDGGRVQCIVLVRDDFWMAATRFMRDLEIRLVEGENSGAVDLFDELHAQGVLHKFGRAFDRLPEAPDPLPPDQQAFLRESVNGLARDGKVVSVHLAIFAEMMKSKAWTLASLRTIGGMEGVGVTFLEETFSATTAPPEHRYHEKAARAVLQSLLPDAGSDIKRQMVTYDDLRNRSGYASRSRDFDELLRVLDTETRLITPTDPEGAMVDARSQSEAGHKYYQLTHDYLVPSLRTWLTRKQKETYRGRAELRLAERARLWNAKPENRNLPSWWEHVNIRLFARKRDWTGVQQRMMRRSGLFQGIRAATLAVLFALLGWASFESYGSLHSAALVRELGSSELDAVPDLVHELNDFRSWADESLRAMVSSDDPQKRLRARLALLPVDRGQVSDVTEYLLTADPSEIDVIRRALADHKEAILDDLWHVVETPSGNEDGHLLQAACALALFAPDSNRWKAVADRIADSLVNENSLRVAVWIGTLRPIREHLVDSLGRVFRNRDANYTQTQQDLAADILEDFAADDVEQLTALILDAEPRQFVSLFNVFERHGSKKAVDMLRAEFKRTPPSHWNDGKLDPAWKKPAPSTLRRIEGANGLVGPHFALCQTMPLQQFRDIVETLRESGYRPIRFRPYANRNTVQVAAVWTRDGRDWRFVTDLTAEGIAEQDKRFRADGFSADDVSGYVGTKEGMPAEYYGGLWVKRVSDKDDTRIYVGACDAGHQAAYGAIEKAGFLLQHSLQSFLGADGRLKYCGVAAKGESNHDAIWNLTSLEYARTEYLSKVLWDIDVSNAPKPESTQLRNERRLVAAEKTLTEKPHDPEALYTRGQAHYHLKNNEKAIKDFNVLIENVPTCPSMTYMYRAILHARMGTADAANADAARFRELDDSSFPAYVDAVVAALLGEDAGGMKKLEAFVEKHAQDADAAYDAACAYSIASEAVAENDAAKSKIYADRAVALLQQAAKSGCNDYRPQIQTDSDLDPIRNHTEFMKFMAQGHMDRRYAAVWQISVEHESQESTGLPPKEHLAQSRELVGQGFRPVAVSVASTGEKQELTTASAWHRPLISDEQLVTFAKRRANAAIGLLRLNQADMAWPSLKHDHDPQLRTWISHRMVPSGVGAEAILSRLELETDASVRRAILVALGECSFTELADPEGAAKLLLTIYQDDPDAGIHGAAEYVLRRWGKERDLAVIDRNLAAETARSPHNWFVDNHGHTMVVVREPDVFLMGSPGTEKDRDHDEDLHRMRIDRTYAIASKEVTVRQFHAFLSETPSVEHYYTVKYAPDDDCPQTNVIWYEAAAYCRWLSEKENIPEDQMCYPPVPDIGDGMKLPANFLSRTGYRLPTEAEWEYACRANTRTSRYYGQSDELLVRYAVYSEECQHRSWPVGRLIPNGFGLFDMLGNSFEWCQSSLHGYDVRVRGAVSNDQWEFDPVNPNDGHVLRGGSFGHLGKNFAQRTDTRNHRTSGPTPLASDRRKRITEVGQFSSLS